MSRVHVLWTCNTAPSTHFLEHSGVVAVPATKAVTHNVNLVSIQELMHTPVESYSELDHAGAALPLSGEAMA